MNKALQTASGKSGFTLIEVVVSAVLLTMVMAGTYKIITATASLNRVVRNHYVAVNLAKNRLERARNFPYADLSLLTESKVVVDDNGVPTTSGRFRRTTAINTNYAPEVTQIMVTVDIMNLRSGAFSGESESAASLFTEYLTP
jgi:prepilin-type N-terminal cleavage/methylation domain-containing protein